MRPHSSTRTQKSLRIIYHDVTNPIVIKAIEQDFLIQIKLWQVPYQYTAINKKFWEELIAYLPLIPHGQHTKRNNLGGYIEKNRPQGDLISHFLFFKIRKTDYEDLEINLK
jgi:hypothetical protein